MVYPRIGVVFVCRKERPWQLAQGFFQRFLQSMRNAGLQIIGGEEPAFEENDAIAQARGLEQQGVDCVCYAIGTWIHSEQVVSAALQVRLPTIVMAFRSGRIGSLVGSAVARGSLDEVGIPHLYTYYVEGSTDLFDEIKVFSRAAAVMNELRGKRFGLFGGRSMGMYTATADPSQVKKLFGVEIEHVDQYLVIYEAEKIPDTEANLVLGQMKEKFGEVASPEEGLRRSIKLYLALKKVINEKKLDFIGVKCPPEVLSLYTSYCVAVAFLNNEGIMTACECDINGAITMEILHELANGPAYFGDVLDIDYETRILTAANCGSTATDLAKTPKEVRWLSHPEDIARAFREGIPCVQFVCRPGEVTCARLSRIEGKYCMLIFRGQTVEGTEEDMRRTVFEYPHAFIRMDCDPRSLVQQVRSNHIHFAYGDHRKELVCLCKMLGVEPISI